MGTNDSTKPELGIPYGQALPNGGVQCPICGSVCFGWDSTQETIEDGMTKGDQQAYAEHYETMHRELL